MTDEEQKEAGKGCGCCMFVVFYVIMAIISYSPIKGSVTKAKGRYTKEDRVIAVTFTMIWPLSLPMVLISDWFKEEGPKESDW